jgi:hypothetical protein
MPLKRRPTKVRLNLGRPDATFGKQVARVDRHAQRLRWISQREGRYYLGDVTLGALSVCLLASINPSNFPLKAAYERLLAHEYPFHEVSEYTKTTLVGELLYLNYVHLPPSRRLIITWEFIEKVNVKFLVVYLKCVFGELTFVGKTDAELDSIIRNGRKPHPLSNTRKNFAAYADQIHTSFRSAHCFSVDYHASLKSTHADLQKIRGELEKHFEYCFRDCDEQFRKIYKEEIERVTRDTLERNNGKVQRRIDRRRRDSRVLTFADPPVRNRTIQCVLRYTQRKIDSTQSTPRHKKIAKARDAKCRAKNNHQATKGSNSKPRNRGVQSQNSSPPTKQSERRISQQIRCSPDQTANDTTTEALVPVQQPSNEHAMVIENEDTKLAPVTNGDDKSIATQCKSSQAISQHPDRSQISANDTGAPEVVPQNPKNDSQMEVESPNHSSGRRKRSPGMVIEEESSGNSKGGHRNVAFETPKPSSAENVSSPSNFSVVGLNNNQMTENIVNDICFGGLQIVGNKKGAMNSQNFTNFTGKIMGDFVSGMMDVIGINKPKTTYESKEMRKSAPRKKPVNSRQSNVNNMVLRNLTSDSAMKHRMAPEEAVDQTAPPLQKRIRKVRVDAGKFRNLTEDAPNTQKNHR